MALSRMMSHYLQVKEKHKDCFVFYRLGDFYEMFFDDAIKASEILELTLTGRDCGLKERAPMCGVPFHAADMYISKLVSAGYKVAICEQLSEPNGKELVERDVIRVVTAGTVTSDELIDAKSNNFLLAVYSGKNEFAIAWADITTGEFFAKSFTDGDKTGDLMNELIKISPAEIIGNREACENLAEYPVFTQKILPRINEYTASEFYYANAEETVKNQLKIAALSSVGFTENDITVIPSGALISYLKETQKSLLININSVSVLNKRKFMMLDLNTVRNLEIIKTLRDDKKYGSLLWVLDKTKTSMGARKLQSYLLSPLHDADKINYRLDGVESLFNSALIRQSLCEILSGVKDVGRITGKIANGNLVPKDCVALSKSLSNLPSIKFQLSGVESEIISDIIVDLGEYSDLTALLDRAVCDGNVEEPIRKRQNDIKPKYIKEGYNAELDELRDLASGGQKSVDAIEEREKARTGIKNLRVGYNRVFGYFIEVTNSFKEKVPYDYQRRQTLAGAERYVTEELKDLEEKVLSAVEKAEELEQRLFGEIKAELSGHIKALQKTADAIAELDVLLALSTVAKERGYSRPKIVGEKDGLSIKDGRHPVVEAVSRQRFIPNDCTLDNDENRTMIITGPNMAGKSTYMRQIALITLMAHIGSFVPAAEAVIPLTDRIFTRIGASDNLISDQSTFMIEMSELAYIVKNATQSSLLLLDEIGRGTSTYDGLSIAWASVEYLSLNVRAKTLFATHYHELTELEGIIEGVKNYKITVKEFQNNIIFLRKIVRGGANRSFGIEVATLAGVNAEITERAKRILKDLEAKDITKMQAETEVSATSYNETEKIISELDMNNLSPMQAFGVLSDLYERIKEKSDE